MTGLSVLQQLLGDESKEDFLREAWQQTPWFGSSAGFSFGIDENDIQQYLLSGRCEAQDVRVLHDGSDVPQAEYCYVANRRLLIHPNRANKLFREGCIFVLNTLHHQFDTVRAFSASLTAELGHVVGVNGYYSPPHARGFGAHRDAHDVFVLQLAGAKDWRIHEPGAGLSDVSASPAFAALTLQAGHVMYLPRGWIHEATTSDRRSLHVTIGVHVYTWYDDIRSLTAQLAEDEALLGRAAGSTPDEDVLGLLAPHLRPEKVRRRAQQRIDAAFPKPAADWIDAEEIEALDLDTSIRVRPGLHMTTRMLGDRAEIRSADVTIRFNGRYLPCVEWLLSQSEPGRVGAIPGEGVSDAARIRLAKTLAAEGVIMISAGHEGITSAKR